MASLQQQQQMPRMRGRGYPYSHLMCPQLNAYARLLELLSKEDSLALSRAVCQSISCIDDGMGLNALEVTRFFLHHNLAMRLFFQMIDSEINSAGEEGTLFRGNEPVSSLLTAHARLIGRSFLCEILRSEIIGVCDDVAYGRVQYEIDPIRLKALGVTNIEQTIERNVQNVNRAAERFINRICEMHSSFPLQIRMICRHLHQSLSSKFPDSIHSVLGGYIFLRIICPVIVAPETNGIIGGFNDVWEFSLREGRVQRDTGKVSQDARRGLILISKVLQQLANGVEFGDKESYMIPMNNLTVQYKQKISDFLNQLSVLPDDMPTTEQELDNNKELFKLDNLSATQLAFHKIIYYGKKSIEEYLSRDLTQRSLLCELNDIIHILGKPQRNSTGETTNSNRDAENSSHNPHSDGSVSPRDQPTQGTDQDKASSPNVSPTHDDKVRAKAEYAKKLLEEKYKMLSPRGTMSLGSRRSRTNEPTNIQSGLSQTREPHHPVVDHEIEQMPPDEGAHLHNGGGEGNDDNDDDDDDDNESDGEADEASNETFAGSFKSSMFKRGRSVSNSVRLLLTPSKEEISLVPRLFFTPRKGRKKEE